MTVSDLSASTFSKTPCDVHSGAQPFESTAFRLFVLTLTALAVVVIFLAACSVAGTADVERISFTTVDQGFQSAVQERKTLVIKNEKGWRELEQMQSSPFKPAKPVPTIDFNQEMIVAVFAGEKPTGGYGIEITAIEQDRARQQLRVRYRETKPPAGAMVTQALTQPYHIVRLKRIELPASFVPSN